MPRRKAPDEVAQQDRELLRAILTIAKHDGMIPIQPFSHFMVTIREGELAELMQKSPSTVRRSIRILLKAGMLTRTPTGRLARWDEKEQKSKRYNAYYYSLTYWGWRQVECLPDLSFF